MSTEPTIANYFADRPVTLEIFRAIEKQISTFGPAAIAVGSQISFGTGKRKFAWVWLYNVTKKNPNGILHLMLAIGRPIEDAHVRAVSPVGKTRWNHQIVVRTLEDAESAWIRDLIGEAYQFGTR